jgi:hypothetical protein
LRTADGAAHLADHVLPDVPVRQVVLSCPFELRLLLAARADVFGTMTRMFAQAVLRWQRERSSSSSAPPVPGICSTSRST